jgi:hypothetical protein
MSYKNEFSTYRIAYALSKLHLWNALLNLDFLFSAIALQEKHAIALFSRENQGDLLYKCSTTGGVLLSLTSVRNLFF